MATNKNALIRYKVLDNCFRNPGKRYFIDDLISECENVLLEISPDSNPVLLALFDTVSETMLELLLLNFTSSAVSFSRSQNQHQQQPILREVAWSQLHPHRR